MRHGAAIYRKGKKGKMMGRIFEKDNESSCPLGKIKMVCVPFIKPIKLKKGVEVIDDLDKGCFIGLRIVRKMTLKEMKRFYPYNSEIPTTQE